jgi:putative phage-type endonuclease
MTATLTPSWATPAARLILPADAERAVWLAERRNGIGGSDTAALLGESPYQSLYGLWMDKTGQAADVDTTDAMQRGNWLEPHLARWFTEQTDIAGRRCGLLASREHDHMRTTPDRLTADGGNLEIKTLGAFAKVAEEWRHGGIARHAYIQGQQQLAVTGRDHVWFVVWQDPSPQLRGPVPRDEALIAEIIAKTDDFWFNHVVPRIAPEVDLATITDDEIALRWPTSVTGKEVEAAYPAHVAAMLEERAETKARMVAEKKRADDIDQALRVMAGDAEALLIDGRPVVTFKSQLNTPSVDKALATDHPDIYARYVKRSSSRRIHIVKPRKDAA